MGECIIIRKSGNADTENATASNSKIVCGYTCYVDGELITGDIPHQQITTHIVPGTNVSILYGYYNDTNLISVSTLKEETVASTVSSDLLEGYDGWANGLSILGIMPSHNNTQHSLSVNNTYCIPVGWFTIQNTVTQTLPVQNPVTISPGTSELILCPSGRWTLGNIVVMGDNNLISNNIKKGAIIYGVTGTFIGWVDDRMNASIIMVKTGRGYAMITLGGTVTAVTWSMPSIEVSIALANQFKTVSCTFPYILRCTRADCPVHIKGRWSYSDIDGNIVNGEDGLASLTWIGKQSTTTQYTKATVTGELNKPNYLMSFSLYIICGGGGTTGEIGVVSEPVFSI